MSKRTFLELQTEVAKMGKLDLSDAVQATTIKSWLNLVIEDINSRDSFPWLFDREVVQTVVDRALTGVSVAAAGTAVSSATAMFEDSADLGRFIQFSTSDNWYKITTVTDTSNVVIEAGYVASDALAAGAATVRHVFYSVSSSVDSIQTIRQAVSPRKLTLHHHRTIDEYFPDITQSGTPIAAHTFGLDSSDNWQFTILPIADEKMNLELRYRKRVTDLSADGAFPAIPSKFQNVILHGAFAYAKAYNKDYQDARFWSRRYEAGISRMMGSDPSNADYHPIFQRNETDLNISNTFTLPEEIAEAE